MIKKAFVFLFIGLLFSCHEKEDAVNLPPVAAFESADGTDRITLNATISTDGNGDALFYRWTSSENAISFGSITNAETFFKIPVGPKKKSAEVTLTVSDGKFEDTMTQTIAIPDFSLVRSYGLGKNLNHEVSNNVSYDWYFDQANSGSHTSVNCGPASVTMSIKWFDENFNGTTENARNIYKSSGGWWYTDDIVNYLNKYTVNNYIVALNTMDELKNEVDNGNVVILCLDMYYVKYSADPDYRINKFYNTNGTGWGHFIIVKGYKEVDGQIFYEAYDPYSMEMRYPGGGLKGKDRYYLSSDLDQATDIWWDYAIVVTKSESSGGRKKVDAGSIVHMAGR